MELAVQLEAANARLALGWVPRTFNVEAGALTNGRTDGFDEHKRVNVVWDQLTRKALDRFMEAGLRFEQEARVARAQSKRERGARPV